MQRSGDEGHLEMTVKSFICPRMRASKEEEVLMNGSPEDTLRSLETSTSFLYPSLYGV